MGITKTAIFSEQQNEIANFAKVLGHPARVAILQRLFEIDACVCGDLVSEIGLAQPTISQHLKELKQLGLTTKNLFLQCGGFSCIPFVYNYLSFAYQAGEEASKGDFFTYFLI